MNVTRLVQQFRQGAFMYRLEYVKCCKKNCTKCSEKASHGPYWYALLKRGDKIRSIYIGSTLILLDSKEGQEKFKTLKLVRDAMRQKLDTKKTPK